MRMTELVRILFWLLLLRISKANEDVTYSLIGVSGTLQDGFPLRDRLDFVDPGSQSTFPAIFLGTGLVRGYKAYLDIKDEGCREYRPEPGDPHVPNAVVMPTGCHHHANIYHLYLVVSQQLLHILAGEPRFLSITPDTGMVDLEASETDSTFRDFALREIRKAGKSDTSVVAVPLVTGVWFNADTFIESTVLYTKSDGTNVTSFDGGLSKWTGIEDRASLLTDASIYRAIRSAEKSKPVARDPYNFDCEKTRFGVSPDQVRINYEFNTPQVQEMDL